MHSPCILVASLLYAREYTAPIHSTGSHPNTSLLRARWTPACTLRPSYIHHGGYMPGQLLPAACGTTSIHSACTLREERPRRTAVHFFPHTRPPDTLSHPLDSGAAVEYQGPLVNTYFSIVLSSMPKQRPRMLCTLHTLSRAASVHAHALFPAGDVPEYNISTCILERTRRVGRLAWACADMCVRVITRF
jgi:hypothetical protein